MHAEGNGDEDGAVLVGARGISEVWMLGAQVLLPEGCADAGGRLRVRSLLRAQLRAL